MRGLAKALLLSLAASTLILPSAGRAFSKEEHFYIANAALELALDSVCSPGHPSAACPSAEELLLRACAEPDCAEEKERLWFGSYNRAADFFTHTERLVSDPWACAAKNARECWPQQLFETCAQGGASCLEEVEAAAEQRIRGRQGRSQAFLRWTATHRNVNHFREAAACRYHLLHRRAVKLATAGAHSLALKTEAVALHFLQDLFAPGHLASARADFDNVASGFMHDRYNRKGLPFALRPNPLWVELTETLEALLEQERSTPALYPHALTLGAEDLRAFRAYAAAGRASYRALGDKRLEDRQPLEEGGRVHRTFLVLASAASILEVLDPSREAPQVCFESQSAEPGETSRPDISTYRPPAASLQWPPSASLASAVSARCSEEASSEGRLPEASDDAKPSEPVGSQEPRPGQTSLLDCPLDRAGTLAGYRTRELSEDETKQMRSLFQFNPRSSGFEFAYGDHVGGGEGAARGGRRVELAWNFIALVPDSEVTNRQTGRTYSQRGSGLQNTWSLTLLREELADFDATGLGFSVMMPRRFQRRRLLAWYLALDGGMARYENSARRTDRWRGAVRAGFGLDVLYAEIGAERGFALAPDGAGSRGWRYFAGLRLRLSSSWLG